MHEFFSKIGIVSNKDGQQRTLNELIEILDARKIKYLLDDRYLPKNFQNPHIVPRKNWDSDLDLALIIGGDGTFLSAGRELYSRNIPLLGINRGHLGFLADINADNLESEFNAILDGEYICENRQLLAVEVERQGTIVAKFRAVNELVIHLRAAARMVELDTYNSGEFLCKYRADGLIISTPTGSTAYALSAGASIISPTVKAFLIVPICPHTLSHRPVILDFHSEIMVIPRSDTDMQISVDGQEEFLLTEGDKIHAFYGGDLRVLHPKNYSFQDRLREKLNWGIL